MEIKNEIESHNAEVTMDSFVNFFLWLNGRFPRIEHPFNRVKAGHQGLNYADFEFDFAEKTYEKYEAIFPFREWIRGKTVCDFACGGGGKSVYLAKLGAAKVTGLDLNSNFIEQAGVFAKAKGVESICGFRREDVQQTSLPSGSFDGVIFNDAVDHIADPQKALQEALRVVKPGGLIFVNFESYLFPYGHHLLDGIRIPWIHLFTTEKFRMKLYEKTISQYSDAKERLQFRQHYLNKLTLRRFQKITSLLERKGDLQTAAHIKNLPRRKFFRVLSKLPVLSEFFLSTALWVFSRPRTSV